jgi:molybdopterin molybdotransferase
MISVKEAQQILSNISMNWGTEKISFSECDGRFLAENILADRDYPPFDRAMMDGFAIRFADWQKGQRTFSYQHQQWAGSPFISLLDEEACEITTGAAVPNDFDVVIPVEKVILGNNGTFTCLDIDKINSGWNIQKQGVEYKRYETVLQMGTFITSAVKAVLASCGILEPLVHKQPSIAIVSTGDELVPMHTSPQPHQIRASNAYALESLIKSFSSKISTFHLNDDPNEIETWMSKNALAFDILLFSGGVSKGGKDYLPALWKESGFNELFHGIKQKPGKPMWLGLKDNTILFGFPGNPVSTLTCAIAYLLPWMKRQWTDQSSSHNITINETIIAHNQLDLWIPVVIDNNQFRTLTYKGSGDLIGFSDLNGIIHVTANNSLSNNSPDYRFYPITIF